MDKVKLIISKKRKHMKFIEDRDAIPIIAISIIIILIVLTMWCKNNMEFIYTMFGN